MRGNKAIWIIGRGVNMEGALGVRGGGQWGEIRNVVNFNLLMTNKMVGRAIVKNFKKIRQHMVFLHMVSEVQKGWAVGKRGSQLGNVGRNRRVDIRQLVVILPKGKTGAGPGRDKHTTSGGKKARVIFTSKRKGLRGGYRRGQ